MKKVFAVLLAASVLLIAASPLLADCGGDHEKSPTAKVEGNAIV